MSVERLRLGLIARVAIGRAVEQTFEGVAGVLQAAGRGLEGIAEAAFLIQADAANQYRDLTGTDLSEILGYEDLYDGSRSEEVSFLDEDDD